MDGFAALEQMGAVVIMRHENLLSFEGLKNAVSSIAAEGWTVEKNGYNPTYDDMQAGKWTQNKND